MEMLQICVLDLYSVTLKHRRILPEYGSLTKATSFKVKSFKSSEVLKADILIYQGVDHYTKVCWTVRAVKNP